MDSVDLSLLSTLLEAKADVFAVVALPLLSQVVLPEALYLYRDGCAMTMPHGSCGTLHDLVALYAQKAKTMPQVVAMHYAVEVRANRVCSGKPRKSMLYQESRWSRVRFKLLSDGVSIPDELSHDSLRQHFAASWCTYRTPTLSHRRPSYRVHDTDAAILSSNALGIHPAHGHQA